MKIINRTDFMQMPEGTVYCKYSSLGNFGEICIKVSPPGEWGNTDWVEIGTTTDIEGSNSSNDFYDIMIECEKGFREFRFDLESTCRDGLYKEKQLFAVYDKDDVIALINKLQSLI